MLWLALALALLAPLQVADAGCSPANTVLKTWSGGGEATFKAQTGTSGRWKLVLTFDRDITRFDVKTWKWDTEKFCLFFFL